MYGTEIFEYGKQKFCVRENKFENYSPFSKVLIPYFQRYLFLMIIKVLS